MPTILGHTINMPTAAPVFPMFNPLDLPRPLTVADLQLAGGCDWYKIHRLVDAENNLLNLLNKSGLHEHAMKLEQMRDDVLAHRMAMSPFSSAKQFLRHNCANDAYIGKWRNEIDKFDRDLAKTIVKEHVIPHESIQLRYYSQFLRQQARASLPFTGYSDPVPDPPNVKPGDVKEISHTARFALTPPVLSGFI